MGLRSKATGQESMPIPSLPLPNVSVKDDIPEVGNGGGWRGITLVIPWSSEASLRGVSEEDSSFWEKEGDFWKEDGSFHRARWQFSPAHLVWPADHSML